MNGSRYYPNFGSVRTVNFTCDVYTNDSFHGVCFPTVIFIKIVRTCIIILIVIPTGEGNDRTLA